MPQAHAKLHKSLPFKDYLAAKAWSSHDLGLLLRSPQHYAYAKASPPAATPAQAFGACAHALVLTPESAMEEIAVTPSGINRRTKAGKEEYALFEASAKGKVIISQADFARASNLAAAVSEHDHARAVLDSAPHREHSIFWFQTDVLSGRHVSCRARPDAYGDSDIVDLKTCLDARSDAFAKHAAKYLMNLQGAYYRAAVNAVAPAAKPRNFVLIAVESAPPHAVAVYVLEDEDLSRGDDLCRAGIAEAAKYDAREQAEDGSLAELISDSYYCGTPTYLPLPQWARRMHDDIYGDKTGDF